MTHPSIALIEDDSDVRELLIAFFRQRNFQCHAFADPAAFLTAVEQQTAFDVIITDLLLPGISGIELTKKIRELGVETPVILTTGVNSTEKAIEAVEAGAYDFVVKPLNLPQLQVSVARALHFNRIRSENQHLRTAIAIKDGVGIDGVIGRSPGILKAMDLARRVAASSANVFISGETGSGKEVIAKAIHQQGDRAKHPFIAINCSAIPENLLESELFGHAKGSFTGASDKKVGLFEEAGQGTIFLDEIGDLPLPLQSKLLRVLQERRIKRIGENQYRPVNARVVSATHRDLRADVKKKTFREDLFFRLNVIPIQVPPLRARKEDILPLAEFFLKKYSAMNGKKGMRFDKPALEYFLSAPWPGNVRELENTVERAVVLSQNPLIGIDDLMIDGSATAFAAVPAAAAPVDVDAAIADAKAAEAEALGAGEGAGETAASAADAAALVAAYSSHQATEPESPYQRFFSPLAEISSLEELTQAYIRFAIDRNGGAKDRTAKALGIDRKTLYRYLKDAANSASPTRPAAEAETPAYSH